MATHSHSTRETCVRGNEIKPDLSEFEEILRCQEEAKSPFCWPLNGTYLCYPECTDYAINWTVWYYWPPAFYADRTPPNWTGTPYLIFDDDDTVHRNISDANLVDGSVAYPEVTLGNREPFFVSGGFEGDSRLDLSIGYEMHSVNDEDHQGTATVYDGPELYFVKDPTLTPRVMATPRDIDNEEQSNRMEGRYIATIVVLAAVAVFVAVACYGSKQRQNRRIEAIAAAQRAERGEMPARRPRGDAGLAVPVAALIADRPPVHRRVSLDAALGEGGEELPPYRARDEPPKYEG